MHIAVSDLWIAYESTTAFEAWLLIRPPRWSIHPGPIFPIIFCFEVRLMSTPPQNLNRP